MSNITVDFLDEILAEPILSDVVQFGICLEDKPCPDGVRVRVYELEDELYVVKTKNGVCTKFEKTGWS